jgi:hypothetical protein
VRIVYEGAATRGRSRTLLWDGHITVDGNAIETATILNNWNLDRGIQELSPDRLRWSAVTTGNYGAIDLFLKQPSIGHIRVDTPFCTADVDLDGWHGAERKIEGGGLGCALRIHALPETMSETDLKIERELTIAPGQERRLYLRVQQEDGHRAWSSPIYVIGR